MKNSKNAIIFIVIAAVIVVGALLLSKDSDENPDAASTSQAEQTLSDEQSLQVSTGEGTEATNGPETEDTETATEDEEPALGDFGIDLKFVGAVEDFDELGIEDVEDGSGTAAATGDTVTVHYTGYLTDGTVFDSSRGRSPAEFALQGLIEGWQVGIPEMKEGGKRILRIPSVQGYGPDGARTIPGGAGLIFEIELLSVASVQGQ